MYDSMSEGTGETEYYKFVLEITVSFLGIHKWEPDIYFGFSPALHLHCVVYIRIKTVSTAIYLHADLLECYESFLALIFIGRFLG
jgi:hypothetical protein